MALTLSCHAHRLVLRSSRCRLEVLRPRPRLPPRLPPPPSTSTTREQHNQKQRNGDNNNHMDSNPSRRMSRCWFSSSSSSSTKRIIATTSNHVFDRRIKLLQRANAARAHMKWHGSRRHPEKESDRDDDDDDDLNHHHVCHYDYLRQEIASRLVDRLDDLNRLDGFPLALEIGAGAGVLYPAICANEVGIPSQAGAGMGGIRKLVQIDACAELLFRDAHLDDTLPGRERCGTFRLVANEDNDHDDNNNNNNNNSLPFPDATFDVVLSAASMHWVNRLPDLFQEIRRVLKPDGCFLLAMIGGTTLPELRASFVMAELERDGGVSPHVGPFVQLVDVGSLLQRAGFTLPTIDVDTLHVSFPSAAVLMEHLQRMGENNAALQRRGHLPLDTLLAATCIYDGLFALPSSDPASESSEVESTIQVIYAIGWTPHESQPQPLPRGSATHRITDMMVEQTKITPER